MEIGCIDEPKPGHETRLIPDDELDRIVTGQYATAYLLLSTFRLRCTDHNYFRFGETLQQPNFFPFIEVRDSKFCGVILYNVRQRRNTSAW